MSIARWNVRSFIKAANANDLQNSNFMNQICVFSHTYSVLRHLLMSGSTVSLMLDNCQFDVSTYTHTLSHTHRFLLNVYKMYNRIYIKYCIHKFNFALPQCVPSVFFFALCKCKCISEDRNGGRKIRNVKSHLIDRWYCYK